MDAGNHTARAGRTWRLHGSHGLGLLLLFGFAVALRAILYPAVVTPAGVLLPVGDDAFYHLRRIWYSVVHFPEVLHFDPYLDFPDGARVIWPPAFDWLVAAVARVVAGPDQAAVERVAVWAPPVLGGLGVVAVALLMTRHVSARAGLVAGALLAILPGHYFYSQLGFVDHHAAVAAVLVGLLGAGMALLDRGPSLGRGLALGAGMLGTLLVWPGALLHVAAVEGVVVLWLLAAEDRSEAAARGRAVAVAHALAALVLAPAGLDPPREFGFWSPMVASYFQPAYFGTAAAVLAAWALLCERTPIGATRLGRGIVAAGLGFAGVALALLLLPGLRDSLLFAAGWFGESESFLQQPEELNPLLWPRGRFDLRPALSRFSHLLFLFPLAWAWLALRAWREGQGWGRGLLLAWAALFFVLALLQRRFANTFSVVFVMVWTLFFLDAWPRLRAMRSGPRMALLATAALVALLCVDAVAGFYAHRAGVSRKALESERVRERGTLGPNLFLTEQAARWLREASPTTAGWLDPSQAPEYGVMTNWSAGHLVRYRAERPLVQDNFGVFGGRANYESAWRYYQSEDEAEALAILDRLRVRYVFADRFGPGSTRGRSPAEMSGRLGRFFGSAGRWTDPATRRSHDVPALSGHRLVWYGRTGRGPELFPEPPQQAVAVFERVPGATIEGIARPGETVEASLDLALPHGRRLAWRSPQQADPAGRYSIRVPYPTDTVFSSAVRAAAAYTIRAGGRSGPVVVPEAAVRAGTRVAGPVLGP